MNYNFDIIRENRIKKKMSQEDLAKKLGYKSRSSICYIENGSKELPGSKLILLANILDIQIGDLTTKKF